MIRSRISGLYAVTPDCADTEYLLRIVQEALKGGANLIQYRNKTADSKLRYEQACNLLPLCRKFGVPFIINDHCELVSELDADGVHLGQNDLSVLQARRLLGKKKIVGVSCYNRVELAIKSQEQSADYVAFGAFFTSVTKPDAVVSPLELLQLASKKLQVPIVAIGGITLANATMLTQRNCDAVAVCKALFGAEDISATAKLFSRSLSPSLI